MTIIGSIVGTCDDRSEMSKVHDQGRTNVLPDTYALDRVDGCFEEVEGDSVQGKDCPGPAHRPVLRACVS